MSTDSELNRLQEERRALMLDAEIYRRVLQQELNSWTARFQQASAIQQTFRASRPLFISAALLGGLFAARNWRRIARWAPMAFSVWRWFKRLTGK